MKSIKKSAPLLVLAVVFIIMMFASRGDYSHADGESCRNGVIYSEVVELDYTPRPADSDHKLPAKQSGVSPLDLVMAGLSAGIIVCMILLIRENITIKDDLHSSRKKAH